MNLVDFARRDYADVLVTEEGYAVAEMELSRLRLERSPAVWGMCALVARRRIATLHEMHPRERELFITDMVTAGQAVEAVSGPITYTIVGLPQLHVVITPGKPAQSVGEALVGDIREVLGYIRDWVNNPPLAPFLDHQGRVNDWPPLKKGDAQEAVRHYLAEKFEIGQRYTEPEVNDLLNRWATFDDWALLRRELIMHGLLDREQDGSAYWRKPSAE